MESPRSAGEGSSDGEDARAAVLPVPPRPDVPRRASWIERALPVAVPIPAFFIPFLGPLVGLLTPIVAAGAGRQVWHVRRWVAALAGVGVVVLQWFSLVVASVAWGRSDPVEFLLIPLCAPTGSAWLLAAAAAVVAYLIVAALSIRLRAIWVWPIGAAIGGATLATTWAVLDDAGLIHWIC